MIGFYMLLGGPACCSSKFLKVVLCSVSVPPCILSFFFFFNLLLLGISSGYISTGNGQRTAQDKVNNPESRMVVTGLIELFVHTELPLSGYGRHCKYSGNVPLNCHIKLF